jgi:acyl-coenzyme A synthetase/AMP-(fatty) acid ligase
VPSLLRDLLQQGLGPPLADCGLRVAVSAGEALPAALRQSWDRRTGVPLVNGYGASETMCLVLVDRGEGLLPAPGVEVRWADADQHPRLPGRLLIRAPTAALGYWQRPDAQAEHFRAGGFCPGDLFAQPSEGHWVFAGREDSLVKVNGRWVDLVALEEALAQTPGVLSAAAVAVADGDGVASIALFHVARAGVHADAAHKLAVAVAALPLHQRPRWIHAVPELPRTATGKLLRRQLQQMHEVLARSGATA